MKVSELIDALGGTTETAKIAGVGKSAVSNWRAAEKIPARLGLFFHRVCAERDIEFRESWFDTSEAA